MKARARTVGVVAVVVALFALPYVLLFRPPAGQILSAISARSVVDGNSAPEQARLLVSHSHPIFTVILCSFQLVLKLVLSSSPSLIIPHCALQGLASAAEGNTDDASAGARSEDAALRAMLASAATADRTVIITTLNQAWAAKGTMIDVFLESFRRGEGTQALLRHVVIVALDQRSYERCREVHRHCFRVETAGVDFSGSKGFMSHDFLKMMWRRMRLLRSILELGYNFVFTVSPPLHPP